MTKRTKIRKSITRNSKLRGNNKRTRRNTKRKCSKLHVRKRKHKLSIGGSSEQSAEDAERLRIARANWAEERERQKAQRKAKDADLARWEPEATKIQAEMGPGGSIKNAEGQAPFLGPSQSEGLNPAATVKMALRLLGLRPAYDQNEQLALTAQFAQVFEELNAKRIRTELGLEEDNPLSKDLLSSNSLMGPSLHDRVAWRRGREAMGLGLSSKLTPEETVNKALSVLGVEPEQLALTEKFAQVLEGLNAKRIRTELEALFDEALSSKLTPEETVNEALSALGVEPELELTARFAQVFRELGIDPIEYYDTKGFVIEKADGDLEGVERSPEPTPEELSAENEELSAELTKRLAGASYKLIDPAILAAAAQPGGVTSIAVIDEKILNIEGIMKAIIQFYRAEEDAKCGTEV